MRPTCEARLYPAQGKAHFCPNPATKILKITEHQTTLVCDSCRDLLRAKSPEISVAWRSPEQRDAWKPGKEV